MLAVVLVLAQIGRTALTTVVPVLAYQGGLDTTRIGALFAAFGVVMLVLATALGALVVPPLAGLSLQY
ncbi:hypothetical protein [Rathayibacter rathayi]|uniref:Major facilitator superfamily (MFS) profile domain-containing protein n=1 Tax=Rathayibacter rathayi TaxID=33887 RepID=A0ABD6W6M3_RATRA|nr:hypothetical protein [Rathayibacter rathayi]AZZ49492.1 hypothetical protein C1O28_10040 [Rathayibacter rathayi]MWV73603.1 hypothetical protein [Rathayibacter rathayi NCPPB 2980 = VKM Ac-1601]PPF11736.1 hypothetical protein C5C04_11660 [Rathayibacter rathayi]PPF22879.1 hypothetical protein C5C34_10820 [Rathayibacter rathayi]PPF47821.1 hypothetical protein C5C08_10575 [Rathayibacter rathayi]